MAYVPEPCSAVTLQELSEYVQRELARVGAIVNAVEAGFLSETFVAPAKPRTGDVRFADGTSWNPGLGRGAYMYYSGAWNKLG